MPKFQVEYEMGLIVSRTVEAADMTEALKIGAQMKVENFVKLTPGTELNDREYSLRGVYRSAYTNIYR